MEARLLKAAVLSPRNVAWLAVLAIAIGASVASTMLNVSGDVSRKLAHELRALGPNLLVMPPASAASSAHGDEHGFLDERMVRQRMRLHGVTGVPVLYVVGTVNGQPVLIAGSDLAAARALHPQWKLSKGIPSSFMGYRSMRRLGLEPGSRADLTLADGTTASFVVGVRLEAGGPDDEAWWLPLAEVQRLSHLENRASLFQAHIEGGPRAVEELRPALEAGGQLRLQPIGALTATEAHLLDRARRLMALVTIAALLSAGLCAFGTLADRVLEHRRDFALMKALGAGRRGILRRFGAEAIAIGIAGGLLGWVFGLAMSDVIGRQVFHAAIGVRWEVPPIVIGLAVAVALLASIGPARMALRVEPAATLKGD